MSQELISALTRFSALFQTNDSGLGAGAARPVCVAKITARIIPGMSLPTHMFNNNMLE
jgi:hypothetical protein